MFQMIKSRGGKAGNQTNAVPSAICVIPVNYSVFLGTMTATLIAHLSELQLREKYTKYI